MLIQGPLCSLRKLSDFFCFFLAMFPCDNTLIFFVVLYMEYPQNISEFIK